MAKSVQVNGVLARTRLPDPEARALWLYEGPSRWSMADNWGMRCRRECSKECTHVALVLSSLRLSLAAACSRAIEKLALPLGQVCNYVCVFPTTTARCSTCCASRLNSASLSCCFPRSYALDGGRCFTGRVYGWLLVRVNSGRSKNCGMI